MPVAERIFVTYPFGVIMLVPVEATVAGFVSLFPQFAAVPERIFAADGIDGLRWIDARKCIELQVERPAIAYLNDRIGNQGEIARAPCVIYPFVIADKILFELTGGRSAFRRFLSRCANSRISCAKGSSGVGLRPNARTRQHR